MYRKLRRVLLERQEVAKSKGIRFHLLPRFGDTNQHCIFKTETGALKP